MAAQDPYGFARGEADLLLARVERFPVGGLNKLADDCANNVIKFTNILAEVRIGLLFAAVGARVHLLRDEAFQPAKCTPDLLVELGGGLRLLVEVIRGWSGSPELAAALKPRMDARKLSFRVEHFIGRRLTVSGVGWNERVANRAFCDRVAEKICDELSETAARGETSGIRAVFQTITGLRVDRAPDLYEDVPPSRLGEEWIANFRFEPSWSGEPSPGGGATIGRIIEDKRHRKEFLLKLRRKAEKRHELPGEHLSTPFVVAVENHETELLPQTVLSALTGSRQQLGSGLLRQDSEVPQQVAGACGRGWTDLMKAWSYIDSPSMRLTSYGVFGDGAAGWASDLSAVLVTHYGGATTQWLPNPFAAAEIEDRRLLRVGFALDALGGPPPEAYWRSPDKHVPA